MRTSSLGVLTAPVPAFTLGDHTELSELSMKLYTSVTLIALSSSACFTIQPVTRPADFIPQTNPELVWVRHPEGEVIPVAKPRLFGDTLVGMRAGTPESVRVALPRIQSI